jgi:short-subunit dehydrogenase
MPKAIIVGASSGIGMEIAQKLWNQVWTIGIAARRIELLEEFRDDLPYEVTAKQIDVNDENAEKLLLELIDELGGMDLFVYVAGIGKVNMNLDSDIELSTFNTNTVGFARMVGAAYRYMAKNGGGHIAVVSSIAGTKGIGVAPAYSASKAMQSNYIEALEQQAHIRGLNIKFTDIRPGFVKTALLDRKNKYPLIMSPKYVAKKAVDAINSKKHIAIIDWKWRIVTHCWKLLPHFIWRRMKVGEKL